jgi:uncharacterized membrane protein YcaP (DUF421 family)
MDDLVTLAVPAWDLALRCVVIYFALLAGLRLTGKREVGQFTLFDLVLVLLVANAVQPAMTGPDSSLLGGIVIIVVLLALNLAVGQLRVRNPRVHELLGGHPTLLVQNGAWLDTALRREGVDREECLMAFREHGIDSVEEVKVAVLEVDGSISVVPKDTPTIRTRRHVRFVHHGV